MRKTDFNEHLETIPKPSIMEGQSDRYNRGKSGTNIFAQASDFLNNQNIQTTEVDGNLHETVIPQVINSTHDPDEIWKLVFEYLRMGNSERTMKAWYSDVYIEKIENGVVMISCSNPIAQEWIQSNHQTLIKKKIENLVGYNVELMFMIRSSVKHLEGNDSKDDKYEYHDPSNSGEQQSLFSSQSTYVTSSVSANPHKKSNLNPKYIMSNFIVGSGNQLAHAVSEAVISNPGGAYNPVFFYGPSGVGKTHLMQSIGNAILADNPNANIIYVPIESFMNDLIESIRTRKNEEFRQRYRQADLLIIDDIQFISTYKKTREELFNTFNALYQSNRQIVIASDRPPKEIDDLPERLRTRFEGGMVVDIQAPDLETRIAILQQKANESDVRVPEETIMFIAQNIESNVRELEGAMTKIITQSKFTKSDLSIEDVAKMLQLDLETKRKRIQPDKIITTVSEIFSVTPRELKGKSRTAQIALARQSAMYLMREELELPLDKVARLLNRKDHTTVIHACSKVCTLIDEDQKMRERIELCKSLLRS